MVAITDSIIAQAASRLLEAAPQGSRVVLFGSQATGQADRRSDVDFLVIERGVVNRITEMLRLGEMIRPLGIAVDILVMDEDAFERWKDVPNSVAYRALREGRSYGPSA